MPRMHRGPRGGRWGLRGGFFFRFMKMFSIPPRMAIINVLRRGDFSSGEIYEALRNEFGFDIPRSLLYYHLDALESMGIIEMKEFRESGKGGAPEKVWRLKLKRIVLDLEKGLFRFEGRDFEEEMALFENIQG